jgi:hypothetical protein
MGCCGDREKAREMTEEQKWDYITLSDFKSTSCLTPLSYGWLWILVIVSVAVYAADAFTCISLLAFNRWSGQVKPKVDFDIAKWIFAICIIISYVFLVYRWIKAVRIIRKGGVAESYLDPLAAVFQSVRDKLGWRRFLVFAELTKSRKGKDYIAIFSYFQFKGAILVVVAQGPRIAINALTLWAVMEANLIPKGQNAAPKDRSPVAQFFINIETMAEKGNKMETVIYFSMLFSLVIWVIAALSLLLSVMFYCFYLVCMIPKSDGRRLSKYCRRKIEARLERIVRKKVGKALEKQDMKRRREEQEALRNGGTVDSTKRAPTLPKIPGQEDDNSSVFSLPRSDGGTLPPYQDMSRNGTVTSINTTKNGRKPTLPTISTMSERPMPQRSETEFSNFSYTSNAPLLDDASSMGQASPVHRMPPMNQNADYFNQQPGRNPPPLNTNAGWSDGRMSPGPRGISPLPRDQRNGLPRNNTGYSQNRNMPVSPLNNPNFAPYDNRAPSHGPAYEMSPVESSPLDDYPRQHQFPAVLRPGSPNPRTLPYPPSNNSSFTSPPPSRSGAGTAPPGNTRPGLPAALQSAIQRREASNPLPARGPPAGAVQMRSATAPIMQQHQQRQQQQQPWGAGNGGYGGAGGNPYRGGAGW